MVRSPGPSIGCPLPTRSHAQFAVVIADRVEPTCGACYLAATGGMRLHRRDLLGGCGRGRSRSSILLLQGSTLGRTYQRAQTDHDALGPGVISSVLPATPSANRNRLFRPNAHCSQLHEALPEISRKAVHSPQFIQTSRDDTVLSVLNCW